MQTILLTGASGGLGKAFIRRMGKQYNIYPVSRSENDEPGAIECDLLTSVPTAPPETQIDWIVHMATTYKAEPDIKMLDNILTFAQENNVENILYVSSWVVHFPDRWMPSEYITMKKACEQKLLGLTDINVRIVRPSVILGDGLMWDTILDRLAPVYGLIPKGLTRSFCKVEEVCDRIEDMIEDNISLKTLTILGKRKSIRKKAENRLENETLMHIWPFVRVRNFIIPFMILWMILPNGGETVLLLLATTIFVLWLLMRHILPSTHQYFAGFHEYRFHPESEEEIYALVHSTNKNIRVRGRNSIGNYFHDPSGPTHTSIILDRYDKILGLDKDNLKLNVMSGAHFGDMLSLLETEGLGLNNYPNYHYISVGASIMTPVHGSSLAYPFLADLVMSFRYYDRGIDEVHSVSRGEEHFEDMIFDPEALERIIILSAEVEVCKKKMYQMKSKEVALDDVKFDDMEHAFEGVEHFELRISSIKSKTGKLQHYTEHDAQTTDIPEEKLQAVKADKIGEKWNLLQKNLVLKHVGYILARPFVNFEWFFTPEDFVVFWDELRELKKEYPYFKLLVRYNKPFRPGVSSPYYDTVSIDISTFRVPFILDKTQALYKKYRPKEHHGKYRVSRY